MTPTMAPVVVVSVTPATGGGEAGACRTGTRVRVMGEVRVCG